MRVEVHDDHFEPGAPDEVWLRVVGERGWFVVTKDQKIRYHAIERQALIGARVGAFILISKDLSGEEIGKILVGAVPAIGRFILKTGRPFLAKINREGKISAILED
ncbi:hypothetical protein EPO44_16355 [bacterium]|nr:MAG: hypothetical protein EPO44_16355 [bacterium]